MTTPYNPQGEFGDPRSRTTDGPYYGPPVQQPMPSGYGHGPVAPQPPKRKNWFRRHPWLSGIGIGVIAIIIIASASGGGSTDSEPSFPNDRPENNSNVESDDAPKVESDSDLTVSQENAIESAESYLETMPFSKQGLIDQLSSNFADDYPKADAEFAVDYLDIDYKAQAARAAENYMATMSFSEQGLISQLESNFGDQYTHKQAVYGASTVF